MRQVRFNSLMRVALCLLLVGIWGNVLGDDPNIFNQTTEECYGDWGGCSGGESCGWEIAAVRNGTSEEGSDGGQLTIEINTCEIPLYEIYRFPQVGGAGGTMELNPGDVIIVWDEDDGHGSNENYRNFTFTNDEVEKLDVSEYDDYLYLTSTDSYTNWSVYLVLAAGTFVKGQDGTNEHEVLDLTPEILFWKDDGLEDPNCVLPDDEITYTICYENPSDVTYENVWIIDYLPMGVIYPQGAWSFDPNLNPLAPDPNYDPDTHSYVWEIGELPPDASGCFELTVTVTEQAEPGVALQNVAEIWDGELYAVSDANNLLAIAVELTPVCCWGNEPNIIYVDVNANGLDTGVDWQNAYSGTDGLQKALARVGLTTCPGAYTIYVAQGIYTPGPASWDSFILPDNVYLYGGFPTGGGEFYERVPRKYETILTGSIDPGTHNETVVTMGDETVLDGFTVTNATDNGIYGDGVDFVVENCRIVDIDDYGILAENGNIIVKWCVVSNCDLYGIRHEGQGYTLSIMNCQVTENQLYGVYCLESTPTIKNSVIARNDKSRLTDPFYMFGHEGISIVNPTDPPVLHNNTIAHNHGPAIAFTDDGSHGDPNTLDYPDVQNCILWYNNEGSTQFSGFDESHIQYSCIYASGDPDGTDYTLNAYNNFSGQPVFAYFNPDNVHLDYYSPCKNGGNPNLTYTNQADMDDSERVNGGRVDIGADEVDCEDTAHPLDANLDSIINYAEYSTFASAWLSHDPNDPAWLADPNLADPDLSEGWYEWKYVWNFDDAGSSQYRIDIYDLQLFLTEVPWLWTACWMDEEMFMGMSGGGEGMLALGGAEGMMFFETEPVNPYADMPDSELAFLMANLYDIIDYVDFVIAEYPEERDEYADTKAFLDEIVMEMKASRQ